MAEDNHRRIARVLSYIDENMGRRLSLEELARVAGFSTFHFCRLFTALAGESPASRVRRLRLEKAALRLRSTSDSLSAISVSAGYES